MGVFLRKYNVALTGATLIRLPLIKRGVVDFAVGADYTPSAGDVKVSLDGGAAANIGTLPTAVAMGNGAYWEFTLSAAELSAKQVVVTVADSPTKAVEDQGFVVETFGHASAMYVADLAAAALPANVTQFGGSNITATGGRPEVNTSHIAGSAVSASSAQIGVNVVQVSGDSAAADNLEAAADGTGYNLGGGQVVSASVTGAVGSVTGNVGGNVAGSVGSVTGAVGSVTGNVGGNVAGSVASVTGNVGGNVTGTVGGFTSAAKAEIQTEAEDAIVAHRLDELLNADSDIDGAAPPTVGSVFHELMSKTTGSFTFDQTTDSLEAVRDKQTDIETDTQDIQNRLPAALVGGRIDSNVGAISSDSTAADNAEAFFDGTGYAGTGNTIPTVTTVGTATALGAQAKADVNAEVLDVLATDTFAEPTAAPAATSSLKDKLNWIFSLHRNKRTQTSTTETLLRDDGSTTTATSTKADDGSTYTRGEWT